MERAGSEPVAVASSAEVLRAVADNLARVVHAPEETLRLCVLCLVSEGHLIIEDFPGVGKTMLAKALARSLDCSLLAPAVHARPAALGRDRRERLQPALERVRVPARPRLHEPAARRRDQPRLAEDAGRAARVHAGEPGHDRRRHARAADPFMVMATQNPIEYEGTYPLPGGAARPLHDADRDRLPAAGRGGEDADRADRRAAARLARAGDLGRGAARGGRGRRGGSSSRRASTATSSRCSGTRAATRASTSAPARAPGSRCCASPRRARCSTSATTSSPDDVKAVAEPVLAHRLILAPEARAAGLAGGDLVREAVEKTPVPV